MEKFQELRIISNKKIHLAEHILTQTYPLLKDPKLLMSVIENIFLSYANSIGSLLYYEKRFNKINNFDDNFNSKYEIFKKNYIKVLNLKQEDINTINEIKDIIIKHKQSACEFTKEDKFIICSDKFNIKTINLNKIKEILLNAKKIIEKINNYTKKHEEIFAK
jgi:hypothetical protein